MYRLFLLVSSAAALLAQTPKVTGPIPVTATSHPFLAANQNLTPLALAKAGYVEEENLISGPANAYDWAPDAKAPVQPPNAPYPPPTLLRLPSHTPNFHP